MSLVQTFVKGLKGLKVQEVPGYFRSYASHNLTPAELTTRFNTWKYDFKAKQMDTGASEPFVKTAWAIFFLSYGLSWPREYAHMKAEEAAKLSGESGHH